jgi:predicted kinase
MSSFEQNIGEINHDVVVLCGSSGAGKSTFAQRIGYPIVSLDQEFYAANRNRKLGVRQFARKAEKAFKSGNPVTIDALNLHKQERISLLRLIRLYRREAALVFCATEYQECLQRQSARKNPQKPILLQRHSELVAKLNDKDLSDEGWDQVIVLEN